MVLLAGGFNQHIVQEVLSSSSTRTCTTVATLTSLKRTAVLGPVQRVNTALLPIAGMPSIQYILRAVEGIRRLQPLPDCVYIVCNEVDRPLFIEAGAAAGPSMLS